MYISYILLQEFRLGGGVWEPCCGPVSFLGFCWLTKHEWTSALSSAPFAGDGFSGLSGPHCAGFPEFSGAGCWAGLHLFHSTPQFHRVILPCPGQHAHPRTHTFCLDPPSWAEKPGKRVAKELLGLLNFGEHRAESSGWLDTLLSLEAWSCCRRCAWPWLKWWVWLRLSAIIRLLTISYNLVGWHCELSMN